MEQRLSSSLHYHCLEHTQMVMEAAEHIGQAEGLTKEERSWVQVAAAYHDCGFLDGYADHESSSCLIMRKELPSAGCTIEQMDMLCEMVMATRIPQSPKTLMAQVLCDADLEYLGGDRYSEISETLRSELEWHYGKMDDARWLRLQIDFLEQHRYWTQYARVNFEAGKQEVLASLKSEIPDY